MMRDNSINLKPRGRIKIYNHPRLRRLTQIKVLIIRTPKIICVNPRNPGWVLLIGTCENHAAGRRLAGNHTLARFLVTRNK